MDHNVTLNQNAAECIQSAAYLTGTLYKNICSGVSEFVPYGALDYVFGGFMIAVVAGLVGMLTVMAVSILRDD